MAITDTVRAQEPDMVAGLACEDCGLGLDGDYQDELACPECDGLGYDPADADTARERGPMHARRCEACDGQGYES